MPHAELQPRARSLAGIEQSGPSELVIYRCVSINLMRVLVMQQLLTASCTHSMPLTQRMQARTVCLDRRGLYTILLSSTRLAHGLHAHGLSGKYPHQPSKGFRLA